MNVLDSMASNTVNTKSIHCGCISDTQWVYRMTQRCKARNGKKGSIMQNSTFLSTGSLQFQSTEIRRYDGSSCKLSRLEAALLRYLAAHAGRVVTRAELLADVWNLHPDRVKTRTVDMHVSKLRHKLAASDDQSRILVTLHKRGYMLRPFVCAAEHTPAAA